MRKINIREFEDFLYNKNLKKRTVEQYIYYLMRFSRTSKRFNQSTVNKFLSDRSNRNGVARHFLGNLKKFLVVNYKDLEMTTEERLDASEVEFPEITGREKKKLIMPLTEEQVWKVVECFDDEKYKLGTLLMFYAGLRIAELLRIQISSINWDDWKKDMSQIGECRVYGKGSKEDIAFFPAKLMKRLARYIRTGRFKSLSSYIFLNNVEDITSINLESRKTVWNQQLKKAGIDSGITKIDSNGKIVEGTQVHPHKLRHSYGFYLRSVKKLDVLDIKVLMRHSRVGSSERYIHVDKNRLKDMLRRKPKKYQDYREFVKQRNLPS